MSSGMKESAEVSDLEFFRRPMVVSDHLQYIVGSSTHTKDDFAAIQDTYYLVPRRPVSLDF